MPENDLKIRRALLSVSDKSGIVELAKALKESGTELIATGRTAAVLKEAGLEVIPIEKISGSPEAFQGRMKTLSFPVFSGILHRRGDSEAAQKDLRDLKQLGFPPIDCVVVNFYPFREAVNRPGISRSELIEEIDIGGPSLVRAAAKNSPDVLVLTSPSQYGAVAAELESTGKVSAELATQCASLAWDHVLEYDTAISHEFGSSRTVRELRYGENPHQSASIEVAPDSPIGWDEPLTSTELSYNNITDLSGAYALASDLTEMAPGSTGVVIVKHGNPCGAAVVKKTDPIAQLRALELAWQGDPVSAFGGVVVFTDPLEESVAKVLSERFVELIAAPGLDAKSPALLAMTAKRKNLKAVAIRRFGSYPRELTVTVPGGILRQAPDTGLNEELKSVTCLLFPEDKRSLAVFGIAVCRALKSNTIALVRRVETQTGPAYQLIGAGQGQPNRVEALKVLAIPRAQAVLKAEGKPESALSECVMISDAFFPFRDTVDEAAKAGIRFIVQPGGSIKDAQSIEACNEHGVAMAFTGVRHFRH